ncbi:YgjV family protein [Marinobacter koreensis]|uniref:YgjV family protein n=1 Tax=Marinobacter koreensis TaxID=335974 RepID=A0ABW0RL62_9GAMM|nr:YgjV family protein [Marinobacter koreensis]MCK7547851.1 YgjV family protein [Marinobacter koreensis]
MSTAEIFGQIFGVIALAFCIAGFANRNDDRLMVLLISANVAFALMFACFQSWTAAALTVLVIVRITLARRYPGNRVFLAVLLAVNLVVAWATWKTVTDIFPLTAAVLGTFGMFMLRGIPLRIVLGLAALSWMLNNLVIGSLGGTLAEGMVLVTNIITIIRLHRLRKKYPDLQSDAIVRR